MFSVNTTHHNGHVLTRASYITQALYNARDNAPDGIHEQMLDQLFDQWDAIQLQETRPYLDDSNEDQWDAIFTQVDWLGAL